MKEILTIKLWMVTEFQFILTDVNIKDSGELEESMERAYTLQKKD
jgi:hypothetical protein